MKTLSPSGRNGRGLDDYERDDFQFDGFADVVNNDAFRYYIMCCCHRQKLA